MSTTQTYMEGTGRSLRKKAKCAVAVAPRGLVRTPVYPAERHLRVRLGALPPHTVGPPHLPHPVPQGSRWVFLTCPQVRSLIAGARAPGFSNFQKFQLFPGRPMFFSHLGGFVPAVTQAPTPSWLRTAPHTPTPFPGGCAEGGHKCLPVHSEAKREPETPTQASEHPRAPCLSSQTLRPGFPGNTTFPTKNWARGWGASSKYPESVSKQIRPWGAGERPEVHREEDQGPRPKARAVGKGAERAGASGAPSHRPGSAPSRACLSCEIWGPEAPFPCL